MSDLERLIAESSRDPLAEARARAAHGQRVIAFAQPDVPVELIIAAGAFPLALPVNREAAPRAQQLLESGFSAASRAVAELWLSGELNFVDAVVMSRGDDSFQRLYYYLCELRRTGSVDRPKAALFDLAKIPRETSLAHTAAAIETLAAAIGSDRTQWMAAIDLRNRRRGLFDRLDQARASAAPPAGEFCERAVRLADTLDADAFDRAFGDWLGAPRAAWSGPRIVLAGSRLTDDQMHCAVAAAGGRVVGESMHYLAAASSPPPDTGDALSSLARYYHALSYGPRHFHDRDALLAVQVRDLKASGAIIWAAEEDESVAWQIPRLMQALQAASVPVLKLARRRSANDGERSVREFIAGLRA